MTTHQLYRELEKLGHFPLVVITVEELIDACEDMKPSREEAMQICKIVCDDWHSGDEWEAAITYALDKLEDKRSA